MAECRRCSRDTDRQTLAEEPLCIDCADWYESQSTTRSADQHGLTEYSRAVNDSE